MSSGCTVGDAVDNIRNHLDCASYCTSQPSCEGYQFSEEGCRLSPGSNAIDICYKK